MSRFSRQRSFSADYGDRDSRFPNSAYIGQGTDEMMSAMSAQSQMVGSMMNQQSEMMSSMMQGVMGGGPGGLMCGIPPGFGGMNLATGSFPSPGQDPYYRHGRGGRRRSRSYSGDHSYSPRRRRRSSSCSPSRSRGAGMTYKNGPQLPYPPSSGYPTAPPYNPSYQPTGNANYPPAGGIGGNYPPSFSQDQAAGYPPTAGYRCPVYPNSDAGNRMPPYPPTAAGKPMAAYPPTAAGNTMAPYPPTAAGNPMAPYPPTAAGNPMAPYPPTAAGNPMAPYPPKAAGNPMNPYPPSCVVPLTGVGSRTNPYPSTAGYPYNAPSSYPNSGYPDPNRGPLGYPQCTYLPQGDSRGGYHNPKNGLGRSGGMGDSFAKCCSCTKSLTELNRQEQKLWATGVCNDLFCNGCIAQLFQRGEDSPQCSACGRSFARSNLKPYA